MKEETKQYKGKRFVLKKRRNNGVILWSQLTTFLQIALLLNERTYNEVMLSFLSFLAAAGLVQARLVDYLIFPASLVILIPQIVILFFVMSMIAGSRKIDYPIDIVAWRFLFVSKDQEEVFGSIFDSEHVVYFFLPVYTRALTMSLVLAFVVIGMLSVLEGSVISRLNRFGWRSLVGVSAGVTIMLLSCLVHQLGEETVEIGPTSCTNPPPIQFRRKPNLIILVIDSWRRDTVAMDSMPQTLQWLRKPKPGLKSLEWKNHDSCSVQSDQGYVSLYYGLKGLGRDQMQFFIDHKDVRSWPLHAARSNGYEMHKVTGYKYDFCWLAMQDCDLYTRDFDTINGINMMEAANMSDESIWDHQSGREDKRKRSKLVLDNMEKLLKKQHQQKSERPPMVISADIQDVHHPLKYQVRPHIKYSKPVIKRWEIGQMYSRKLKITKENKADYVLRLRNRVKNVLLNLDDDIAAWLDRVRPYLNDTIVVMTGDHTDLYFDGDENFFWHGANTPMDIQRQVPMLMHGPTDLLSRLEVPERVVTCHSDVLPSIMEALVGRALGPRWKEELDYHSYFDRRDAVNSSKPSGFAYNSFQKFNVLIEGNRRLYMQDGAVKEARRLDNNQVLTEEEARMMVESVNEIERSTWAGFNNRGCQEAV
eukprot:scaffold535_cov65-Cylindrotheca_fusiformis.AAC.5